MASFDVTLNLMRRTLDEAGQMLVEQDDKNGARDKLDALVVNLQRISPTIGQQKFEEIMQPVRQLLELCSNNDGRVGNISESDRSDRHTETFHAETIKTGRRGRPAFLLPKNQLLLLLSKGYTAPGMAAHFKCSTKLVYKRLYEEELKMRDKYTNLSKEDLETKISSLHKDFPNSGAEMMCGYLRSQGIVVQRGLVRDILSSIDPQGTAERWGRTVVRRTYRVPNPNSLWHMDAHMKLIRWGFVTHGCIDGYSRCVTYLKCATSNKAEHVVNFFLAATRQYGIPSRVRSDHGGENFLVAVIMNLLRGVSRASHITGQSTHNERIERLWRDVFKEVIEPFYKEFYLFESEGHLNPDDNLDKCALQFVYLDLISERLETFRSAWNNHRIRTEHNRTPEQIWLDGMLNCQNSTSDAVAEVFSEEDQLERMLQSGLARYHLNEDHMDVNVQDRNAQLPEPEHSVFPGTRHVLTPQKIQDLNNAIIGITSPKQKYLACVTKLKLENSQ